MRQIVIEVSLISNSVVAVVDGSLSAFFANIVLSNISQSILKLVLPIAVLLTILELSIIDSRWLFEYT